MSRVFITKTAEFVKETFEREGSGHDWWHVYRVWQLAKRIAGEEAGADMLATELAALLHDMADPKLVATTGMEVSDISNWLEALGVDQSMINKVMAGIQNTSFSSLLGSASKSDELSIEAKIISDADKLEAMGAIGIARAFAYGGSKGRLLHDPGRPLQSYESAEEYHANDTPTINHFYEKLLLLKDRMYTTTGKRLAEKRHEYMEYFLEEFYAEWDGKR